MIKDIGSQIRGVCLINEGGSVPTFVKLVEYKILNMSNSSISALLRVENIRSGIYSIWP
jgi:hypothetical protein